MTTLHTYTWADVDALNSHHYGRGKPRELLDAEQALDLAEAAEQRAIEDYYGDGYGDRRIYQAMQDAKAAAELAMRRYSDVYAKYYGKPQRNQADQEEMI